MIGDEVIAMNCEGCGTRTMGHTGFCRTCKSRKFHGRKRVKEEGLLVEKVTESAGSPWCAWNTRGDVIAGPSARLSDVLIELGREA